MLPRILTIASLAALPLLAAGSVISCNSHCETGAHDQCCAGAHCNCLGAHCNCEAADAHCLQLDFECVVSWPAVDGSEATEEEDPQLYEGFPVAKAAEETCATLAREDALVSADDPSAPSCVCTPLEPTLVTPPAK